MRLSVAPQPPQPPREHAAADFVRRLVQGQPADKAQPAMPPVQELPLDLDQRVRLIGEW